MEAHNNFGRNPFSDGVFICMYVQNGGARARHLRDDNRRITVQRRRFDSISFCLMSHTCATYHHTTNF